ncbi:MAG TPA: TolC family protein [Steroidobacteraceae bacterium]|nr:TolC family protein [Steroidobacteraceae bacterium]
MPGCACSLLAAGCVAQRPLPSPPAAPAGFEHAAQAAGTAWPGQDWYRGFGSEELDTLVDFAVSHNTDLAQAGERVAEADARARQAGAAILPSVGAEASGNYLAGHSAQGSGHELDWLAMLSASYEVDFWGKNGATAHAALLEAGASRAARATVQLTLLGGVADEYFHVLALRERSSLARLNRDAAAGILAAVEARFGAGLASPTDVALQKAALDRAQIAIADLARQELEARAALALLLGRNPEDFQIDASTLGSLREPVVSPGLPSELLTRRPDVAAAEANLRAASADLTAARAALFPSLALTAAAGVQNPALPGTVLTIGGTGPSLALAANLTQPIFDHGRLRARRDEAAAHERELLAAYRAAILAALVDVENSLGALEQLDATRSFQHGGLAESERAFEGARLRYQHGAGDLLTLLEAQRILYEARDQFVQYRLARLEALVALCKALGGGWQAPPSARSAREPRAAS